MLPSTPGGANDAFSLERAERSLPLGPRRADGRGAHATERERQGDHAPAAAHSRVDQQPRPGPDRPDQRERRVLGRGPASDPAERLDRLGASARARQPSTATGRASSSTAALFTATLYRQGTAIFRTRVGVGKPYWPTPAGEFYVRERITGFSDLIYGPIAFGTNGRSAVLTDWPGGGFIGIHGTNQPEILPGQVSHGCVRMPNAAVIRLSRLMPLGTPVTIT